MNGSKGAKDAMLYGFLISTWYSAFTSCYALQSDGTMRFQCWPTNGAYIDQEYTVIQVFNIMKDETMLNVSRINKRKGKH